MSEAWAEMEELTISEYSNCKASHGSVPFERGELGYFMEIEKSFRPEDINYIVRDLSEFYDDLFGVETDSSRLQDHINSSIDSNSIYSQIPDRENPGSHNVLLEIANKSFEFYQKEHGSPTNPGKGDRIASRAVDFVKRGDRLPSDWPDQEERASRVVKLDGGLGRATMYKVLEHFEGETRGAIDWRPKRDAFRAYTLVNGYIANMNFFHRDMGSDFTQLVMEEDLDSALENADTEENLKFNSGASVILALEEIHGEEVFEEIFEGDYGKIPDWFRVSGTLK